MQYDNFSGIYKDKSNYFDRLVKFHNSHKTEIYSKLPFATAELTDGFSDEEFLSFIYEHGSKKLYLGKDKIKLEKTFKIEIDDKKFDRISGLTDSSGYIEIPSRWGVYNIYRRIAYEKAYKEGMEEQSMIQIFGITKRTFSNLKNGLSDCA
ncbi:MAG: hypothetical protein HRT37_22725 [Alteromonadaceae bacterium]|nr:hypothetical protein [Alteromonadaceae bacterium]